MKQLILISALLFSFNGWADNHYTEREPINLLCKPTKVKLYTSKFDCNTYTTANIRQSDPGSEPIDQSVTLRETTWVSETNFNLWEMILSGLKLYGTLENNILKTSEDFSKSYTHVFAGKKVSWEIDMISALLEYDVMNTELSYSELNQLYQCEKQQSLLD